MTTITVVVKTDSLEESKTFIKLFESIHELIVSNAEMTIEVDSQ